MLSPERRIRMHLTPHQAKYIAHDLTLQHAGGEFDCLSLALFNASVDLNPLLADLFRRIGPNKGGRWEVTEPDSKGKT